MKLLRGRREEPGNEANLYISAPHVLHTLNMYEHCTYMYMYMFMGLWVFFLRSLLFATSFFLSISEKCSYIRDCSCTCTCMRMILCTCVYVCICIL